MRDLLQVKAWHQILHQRTLADIQRLCSHTMISCVSWMRRRLPTPRLWVNWKKVENKAIGYGISSRNRRGSDIVTIQNTMAWMARVKPEPMLNMKFWVTDSVNAARCSCSTRVRTSNISWEAELTCWSSILLCVSSIKWVLIMCLRKYWTLSFKNVQKSLYQGTIM